MKVSTKIKRIVTIELTEEETQWLHQAMDDYFRGQVSSNELEVNMRNAFYEATAPD